MFSCAVSELCVCWCVCVCLCVFASVMSPCVCVCVRWRHCSLVSVTRSTCSSLTRRTSSLHRCVVWSLSLCALHTRQFTGVSSDLVQRRWHNYQLCSDVKQDESFGTTTKFFRLRPDHWDKDQSWPASVEVLASRSTWRPNSALRLSRDVWYLSRPRPTFWSQNFNISAAVADGPARLATSRSTQPCFPPGLLNRAPASAGVKAGMSPLPGGR